MRSELKPPPSHHWERTIYCDPASAASHDFIDELLANRYIHSEDWKQLSPAVQQRLLGARASAGTCCRCWSSTICFPSTRRPASIPGTTFGLVLGNYRILDRLGAGGMAVVFKAEHLEMRHTVAIKVLPLSSGQDERRSRASPRKCGSSPVCAIPTSSPLSTPADC